MSEELEETEHYANVDLQESLGVTPDGNCKRHPACPVLSLAHNKIMSCRVCFAEEKSVGIRQRKSFAAVVQQLQKNAEANDEKETDSGDETGRRKLERAHSASMQALIVQQPQTMDSIMKRMSQVQNWIVRQKEKEVMSLKLQIQNLEDKLHHAEVQNQESKQTIWALRRTIQQDMKVIKTMAVQKDRSMSQHSSPMSSPQKRQGYLSDSPSIAASPEKPQRRLPSSADSVDSCSPSPMTSPPNAYFMAGPKTPDPDDGTKTPEPMHGIVLENPGASDPLLDKVRQKKQALQSKFQELRAAHSTGKNTNVPTIPQSNNNVSPMTNSSYVPEQLYSLQPSKGGLRRTDANSLGTHSNRSLDNMVELPPEQKHSDIVVEPQVVRTQYWNDEEYASLSADPSKIFSSFRGGLLDIPKSPPAGSHDIRLRDRPKVQLDNSQVSMLKMPRMRGIGRTLSYQSDDSVSQDGMSVGDAQSVSSFPFSVADQSMGFSVTEQSVGLSISDQQSVDTEGPRDIPLDGLAATLASVPFSRRLDDEKPEQLFKNNTKNGREAEESGPGKENRSVPSFERPAPPPLHHQQGGPPPKPLPRKLKRTQSSDDVLDVVPEVNEEEDMGNSRRDLSVSSLIPPPGPSAPVPSSAPTTGLIGLAPPIASSASTLGPIRRPPYAPRMAQDDETVDTTPTFYTEAGASLAAKGAREQQEEKERLLFPVTGAESQDKYGDKGLYTGTVLVTEGLPHGKGCMKYESGREYTGDWVSGQWHGHGKLLNPNGDKYEGEFVLDARHGKGEYRWDNGDVYIGDFQNDRRNGNGKFCFHNGNVYEGEFVDGMFEGFGRYDFDDGCYEGEWRQGRYHGDGELQYANGVKYTGEFRESLAHGFGVELLPDGTKRRGVWERGQPVEFFHRSSEVSAVQPNKQL